MFFKMTQCGNSELKDITKRKTCKHVGIFIKANWMFYTKMITYFFEVCILSTYGLTIAYKSGNGNVCKLLQGHMERLWK